MQTMIDALLKDLSPEQARDELQRYRSNPAVLAGLLAQRVKEEREQIWKPLPGPQTQAFNAKAFEILYGGAAGSGKTFLLLGKAKHQHRSVLLLRRTFPQLEDTLILKSKEIYGDPNFYNSSKHVWEFPDGCRIRFGHLEHEDDAYQYQSAEFDLLGFDELTQFTKFQYEYLLSRARTTLKGQKVQVVSCTNPGGEGNDWVMERWAAWLDETYPHPADPGEIRYFKRDEAGKEIETNADDPDAMSRTFIPARLSDNPYLGEEYRRTLNLLPEPWRSQLLHGDWKAGHIDDAYQVIPREWIKAAMVRWRSMPRPDCPVSAVGVDCARGGDDQHVIAERRRNWVAPLRKYPGAIVRSGQDALALLIDIAIGEAPVNVDAIGIGASAYDFVKEKYKAVAINVSEKADEGKTDKSGKFAFANKRAQYAWALREALDPESSSELALPDDPELLGDLCAIRYKIVANKIRIELKEDLKARLGRSPDCGEAVILTFAESAPTTPRSLFYAASRTQAEAMGIR